MLVRDCSRHILLKLCGLPLLCTTSILTFKEATYVIGYLWCGFMADINIK